MPLIGAEGVKYAMGFPLHRSGRLGGRAGAEPGTAWAPSELGAHPARHPEGRETPLSPGGRCCSPGEDAAARGRQRKEKGHNKLSPPSALQGKVTDVSTPRASLGALPAAARAGTLLPFSLHLSFLFFFPLGGEGGAESPSGTAQGAPTRPARAGLTNQPGQD